MDHLAAHAQEATVVVERDLEVPILVALLDRGEEMLAPVLDPLDRPSQQEQDGGQVTSSGYITNLAPKPPPTSGATTRSWFSSSRSSVIRKARTS